MGNHEHFGAHYRQWNDIQPMGAIRMSIEFGKRLTRLMQEKGFTLKALAEAVDVPQSSLNNWRNGTPSTDYDALGRLADELQVSLTFLLTGKTESKSSSLQELFEEHDFIDALLEVRIKRLVPRGGSAK